VSHPKIDIRVRINLAARDFAVAEMAIDAYLDNDRYTQFYN